MQTVYKYPAHTGTLRMERGAKIIHVGLDPNGETCVWAQVERNRDVFEERPVIIVGTGHNIPPGFEHLGSWQDGAFMWHLYGKVM